MTSGILRSILILFVVGLFATTSLHAQRFEIYGNAGGYWPQRVSDWRDNKLRSEGIYGVKAGYFFNDHAELEGSFGYLKNLTTAYQSAPSDVNPNGTIGGRAVRGFLYDLNGVWNFRSHEFESVHFQPYAAAGVGGLSASVVHGSSAFIGGNTFINSNGIPVQGTLNSIINGGDTFFTFNYGGGVKMMNLWGPLGARAEIRGRTIPNFFGQAITWPELTGGFLLSFGER